DVLLGVALVHGGHGARITGVIVECHAGARRARVGVDEYVTRVVDPRIEVVIVDPDLGRETGRGEFARGRLRERRLLLGTHETGRHRPGLGARLVLQRNRVDGNALVAIRLDEAPEVRRERWNVARDERAAGDLPAGLHPGRRAPRRRKELHGAIDRADLA